MNKPLHRILLLGLIIFSNSVLQAQINVSGTVRDKEGPLIGASIIEFGTTNGVISDLDGNYSIEVQSNESTLVISYIGYVKQSIEVGSRSTIDVTLALDVAQLNEVVVNALGFEQKADNLGSTYSKVETQAVLRSGESTFINALSGKASGVRISKSNGDPGAGASIQIRGASTITGGSQPLIILDGVPLGNSSTRSTSNGITGGSTGGTSQQSRLNDINPNDIESIQILKGASAGALWGSRAANGVVVITTKKGKSGKPTITYSATLSIEEINKRHPLQTQFGQGRNGIWEANYLESWGDKITDRPGGADEVDFFSDYFIAEDGTFHYPIVNKNSRNIYTERNFDQVFRRGHFLQHDLSISGGSDKSVFFFSAGAIDHKGIIKNSNYDKRNIRLNNSTQLNDWLNVTTKSSYISTKSNRIQQGSNISGLYLSLLRSAPDFDNSDHIGTYVNSSGEEFARRHRTYRNSLGQSENSGYSNPLWTTDEQSSTSKVDRFNFSTVINIDPVSWLGITLRGGVDSYTDERKVFFPIFSASTARRTGVYAEDVIKRTELSFDAIARGNFNIIEGLSLNATLGWNVNDRRFEDNYSRVNNFAVNTGFPTFDLSSGDENSVIGKTASIRRNNRGYAVLAFNVFDQVFIDLNGALEAASSYPESFFYPAATVAWQFSQIPLISDIGFLSFGKIRGSWGQVGVEPSAHRSQTTVDEGTSVSSFSDGLDVSQFGGGFRLNDDKGNPDLKPEVKTEIEGGIDLRFLDNRLGVNFTYYYNKIEDLLFDIAIPSSTGFVNVYDNAGDMENTGIEVDLDYDIVKKQDWSVNVFANFNNNKNTVLDLNGATSENLTGSAVSSRAVVGYPLGVLWGTKARRNEDGTLELDANGFPSGGDGGIIGDPNPEWRGGAGINVRWKNFRLNALVEHSQGGIFADRTRLVMYRFGTHADVGNEVTLTEDLRNVDGALFSAGTTVRGNIANFGAGNVLLDESWYKSRGGGFGSAVIYDLAFEENDATWTKLREVSLSYILQNDWLNNTLKLNSVEFTAIGRNLFLWTGIKGIDPESSQFGVTNGFGVEYFTNPSTRSLLFSLKITY